MPFQGLFEMNRLAPRCRLGRKPNGGPRRGALVSAHETQEDRASAVPSTLGGRRPAVVRLFGPSPGPTSLLFGTQARRLYPLAEHFGAEVARREYHEFPDPLGDNPASRPVMPFTHITQRGACPSGRHVVPFPECPGYGSPHGEPLPMSVVLSRMARRGAIAKRPRTLD